METSNYETLEAEEYLSDVADEGQMAGVDEDVLVSVGFKTQEGEWKEAYLESDPNSEFLTYRVDDFGHTKDDRAEGQWDEVSVHRSKVVKGMDMNGVLEEFDPAYSRATEAFEEVEALKREEEVYESSSAVDGTDELDDLF